MKPHPSSRTLRLARRDGWTLIQMVVAAGLSTMVIAAIMALFLFGLYSFDAMSNYAQMDTRSRQSVDLMLREIRQANLVVGSQTNTNSTVLTFANTNASPAITNTFTWTKDTRLLTWNQTGQSTRTLLTGCSSWSYTFYLRSADSNGNFYATSDPTQCKLINMTWSCSRTNKPGLLDSEAIVTAEVVLRNKM